MRNIIPENIIFGLMLENFLDLPIHTQAVVILAVLLCFCFVVRRLIDLWDYVCMGSEKRQAIRERPKWYERHI